MCVLTWVHSPSAAPRAILQITEMTKQPLTIGRRGGADRGDRPRQLPESRDFVLDHFPIFSGVGNLQNG